MITEMSNYQSLHAISKLFSYVTMETFQRHFHSLMRSKKMKVRSVQVGRRTRYHVDDVRQVMTIQ